MPSAVIMAGGTGGHIFPALAVANALRELGWRILWLGTADRLEAEIVPKNGYPIHYLPVKGIRGKGLLAKVHNVWGVLKSIYSALKSLKAHQPDLVLGFGGYPSFPGGVAARMLSMPLIIHEQNASPGLTNKLLGKLAQQIFLGFPSAASVFKLPKTRIHFVGNPVRPEIYKQAQPSNCGEPLHDTKPFRLLILGGSLGARPLNNEVPQILADLPDKQTIEVVHQCGKGNQQALSKQYENSGINVNVCDFIDDMAGAYHWADAVICRAGALTVAEVASAGVTACFIPLPHAVDDHQTKNARYLVDNQAGVVIAQADLADKLPEVLISWINNPQQCLQLGARAEQCFPNDATQKIVHACMQYSKDLSCPLK